jgi:ribonucleoside-diphosphate reductase alpha chain
MSERERLPNERQGVTHRFTIGSPDRKGYLTVGLYEDGRPGEIFIKMDRQGTAVSGFIDAWAIAVSMLLQTGTPMQAIIDKFKGLSFEPEGMTGNPEIPIAKSPIDYIVRWLEKRYGDEAMNKPPEPEPTPVQRPEKKCERCGSAADVSLHLGVMTCGKCRSGKTQW